MQTTHDISVALTLIYAQTGGKGGGGLKKDA